MRKSRTRCLLTLGALALACAGGKTPVAELAAVPETLALGWPELAEVELELTPMAPLPAEAGDPIVFLHLTDESGAVVRTFDHRLPGEWRPGRAQRYRVRVHQSALVEPLPAGPYRLTAGLYDPELGRYALRTRAEEVGRQEYRLVRVSVTPPDREAPQARFSEQWLPPEPGGDRQVLVRRSLRGGAVGTIQFGPVSGPGVVQLGLFVPPSTAGDARFELLDEGPQPRVRIASTCGGELAEITGTGRFDVDLAIEGELVQGTCEVTLEPNFQLTRGDRAETTSVRLEMLAWRREASAPPAD
jgi:hypothetical protein